jgi:hypothetical protein
MENRKVFIGNIPYESNKEEFDNYLKTIPGYQTSNILVKTNNKLIKGYGYIVFKTELDKNNFLKKKNVYIFKNRILRFSDYISENEKKIKKYIFKNILIIDNLPENIKVMDIRKKLEEISDNNIGLCYIKTNIKTGKTSGKCFIEIFNDDIYDKLKDTKIIINDIEFYLKDIY